MPYSKVDPDKMILRDHLAYDRTVLANERTVLSYLRTAIAFFATGGTLIKLLSEEKAVVIAGFILILIGCVCLFAGGYRFVYMKRRLARTYQSLI